MTLIIMMLGMVAAAFSVIFIKIGTINPLVLSSYRLLIASVVLLPWFLKDLKARGEAFHISQIVPSILPGVFLAFHFSFYITGARMVPGAHASLITTLSPVVMPFLMFFMIREKITLWEILGSSLALLGALYLGMRDSRYAAEYLKGDIICFFGMVFVALYMAFARLNRKNTRLWFYTVPVYLTGGIICFFMALFSGADMIPRSSGDWISVMGLALVCTVGGHSINNYGMRKLRGQLVSLINLTQMIYAALLSFLILGEVPPVYFYPAALLILTGPLVVILSGGHKTLPPVKADNVS